MTNRQLYEKMQQEQRALPDGFEARSNLLLEQLTHRERKVDMKKIVCIALAAALLLGSIAYAATQLDLAALVFGQSPASEKQLAYVTAGTQSLAITGVTDQGNTALPLADAWIDNVTAFLDGSRLVIGFTQIGTGTLSCDSFLVNGQEVWGGLGQTNDVYSLDAQLPADLSGQDLTIALPLRRLLQNGQTQTQQVSFTMGGADTVYTPEITAAFSSQMTIALQKGTLSPLGLRIPVKVTGGQQVCFTGDLRCYADGKEIADAWQGGAAGADDVLLLPVTQVPESITLTYTWQEKEETSVYDCSGTAVFHLQSGSAEVTDSQRTFAYTAQPPEEKQQQGVAYYNTDAQAYTCTLKPQAMDKATLMALAQDVITQEVMDASICVDDSETSRSYYTDDTRQELAAWAYYDTESGEISIMGPGAVSENSLGEVDAPNCTMTAAGAREAAVAFLSRFGYTEDILTVEYVDAFTAKGQGGYFVSVNVAMNGTPNFALRYGTPETQWRLVIKERGVCQVKGRLVTAENASTVADGLTLAQAQEKAMQAAANGTFWQVAQDDHLVAIRAVNYVINNYRWTGETTSIPVWEFDFASEGSTWLSPICVNRQTGEVFYGDEITPQKMEGM